eukprot:TRINITY_DN1702_c0_g1_i1.p1 TRINITY_DN1702_c0_g1~~TRINITY_DN1702_c0_g1_i1.p1  ORF type:complete len:223 (+),score=20.23 TRINITY_DN1702_c0_g1_i1:236-904(+)
MVGSLAMVASPLVDSHACPCLCVDSFSLSNLNFRSGADLGLCRKLVGKKQLRRSNSSLVLTSLFVDAWHEWRLSAKVLTSIVRGNERKQQKMQGLVVVGELAGQYEESFDDVKTQILNYFTYKAVRTVLNQLYEMNPPQYKWFYDFIVSNKPGDGKRFIRTLGKEKQDLAERVMVTRLHLYGKWIKKCDHAKMYQEISDQNLELMRERLIETVKWPSDDANK